MSFVYYQRFSEQNYDSSVNCKNIFVHSKRLDRYYGYYSDYDDCKFK